MPWHIEPDHPGCDGYAVVKDEDEELEGCHRTEAQAKAQLAALNIAEADDLEEDAALRAAGEGPDTIILDIDGTLVGRGTVNRQLVADMNGREAEKIVITGRLDTQRDATVQLLERIGLDYEELYMSSGGDPNAHKAATARRLLRSRRLILAIDDNPDARAAYEELGISTQTPNVTRDLEEEIDELIERADEMTNRALVEQILARIRR